MNGWDILILLGIGLMAALGIKRARKQKKKGGGYCGDCSRCGGCGQ